MDHNAKWRAAVALDEALKAVAPVVGVSVGRWDDKRTWRVDFAEGATQDERDAAAAVVAGFDAKAANVPQAVGSAQAKTALFNAGLLAAVEAAIDAAEYPPLRIYYASATEWQRHHAYLLGIQAEVGLTDAQVDDLFRAAAQL